MIQANFWRHYDRSFGVWVCDWTGHRVRPLFELRATASAWVKLTVFTEDGTRVTSFRVWKGNRPDLFATGRGALLAQLPGVFLDRLADEGTPAEREAALYAISHLASAVNCGCLPLAS